MEKSSTATAPSPFYYAVHKGKKPGIYTTWADCSKQVIGVTGSIYKKFTMKEEAELYLQMGPDKLNPVSDSSSLFPLVRDWKKPLNFKDPASIASSGIPALAIAAADASQMDFNQISKSPQTWFKSAATSAITTTSSGKANVQVNPFSIAKAVSEQDNNKILFGSDAVVVYTDGACSGNGKEYGRAGVGVYWGELQNLPTLVLEQVKQLPPDVSEPLKGTPQTNQRAELMAVIRAVEEPSMKLFKLEVRTDSEYSIKCATVWCQRWKQNGWRTADGKEVKNRDLVEQLNRAILSRPGKVIFTWVPGHSGEKGNEKADQLATQGVSRY